MMVEDFFAMCIEEKYSMLYAHNLSNFDGPILLQLFKYSKVFKCEPFLRSNSIYSLVVQNDHGSITLKDSNLICPGSLADLAKAFKVPKLKGVFPHSFACIENLDYVGPSPINPKKKRWSFREESERYALDDVLILNNVIQKLDIELRKEYKERIHYYLTQAGIALSIFKRHFYKDEDNPIFKPNRKVDDFVYRGYTGGATDLLYRSYNPLCLKGKEISIYDVNSLYPSVMKGLLPQGSGEWVFKPGSLDKFFGFVRAKIKSPEYMNVPILPIKMKVEGELKTVYPLGEWIGVYYSEELKNAVKYGYTVELIDGYRMAKSNGVFDEFIDHFYEKKKHATGAYKQLIKLILNALYGRFGLRPLPTQICVCTEDELEDIASSYSIESMIIMDDLPLSSYFILLGGEARHKEYIVEYTKESNIEELDSNEIAEVDS